MFVASAHLLDKKFELNRNIKWSTSKEVCENDVLHAF